MSAITTRSGRIESEAPGLKHPYKAQGILLNKYRFPVYFILTASNAILS